MHRLWCDSLGPQRRHEVGKGGFDYVVLRLDKERTLHGVG